MSTTPDPTLEAFAATWLRVRDLVALADEPQWQPGHTARPDDAGVRGKGTTPDPTSRVASDDRRLALRAAVVEAELRLRRAGLTLQAAERHLRDALEAHHDA